MLRTDALAGTLALPLQSGGEWANIFALVLGFAFLAGLTVLIVMNRWNRADLDGEHAAHILAQLNGFGGRSGDSVVVRSVAALSDPNVTRAIRGLFTGEDGDDGEPTVRSATTEVARKVHAELAERKPSVSKVPIRAVQEAVLTAVLGALAMVPVAAWREASRSGGGAVPTLPELISGGRLVLDIAVGFVTAFPFTSELIGMVFAAGVLGASVAWTLWMVPPVVLLVLAIAYLTLDRRVETDRDLTGPPVLTWARRFVALTAITWAVGAVLATLAGALALAIPLAGRVALAALIAIALAVVYVRVFTRPRGDHLRTVLTDEPGQPAPTLADRLTHRLRMANWKHIALITALAAGLTHELVALFAALAFAVGVISVWLSRTVQQWSLSAARDGRDALALDVAHSLTVTAAALTLPLMAGYAIVAFGTGKAIAIATVVLDAPSATVLAVAFLAVMVALALAVAFLKRFRDIRRGISRALSVRAVRTVMWARAFPVLLVVLTAVLLVAFRLPAVAVVAVSLAVGLIARFAYMSYNYVTYRVRTRPSSDRSASRVVINGRTVTDAAGEPVYIAAVNGHRTAHRRVDALVNQIRRDTRSLLRDGSPETGSWARYYYVQGVKRGKVDMEQVADELLGDVRTRFRANVTQTDAAASEILDKLHAEYPPHVVDRVVEDLKDSSRVSRREDEFIWMG